MSRICTICGKSTNEKSLYRKCQPCFERGKFEERQTGRTCAQLEVMMQHENSVFVLPLLNMVHHLQRAYPKIEKQIMLIHALPSYLRGRKNVHVFYDHTVTEMLRSFEREAAEVAIQQTSSILHR